MVVVIEGQNNSFKDNPEKAEGVLINLADF